MYPCHIFKSVGCSRFLLTSATQRLKTVCNMINEHKNCTAAPGRGGGEATVVKVGGISSSHQIPCISSWPICSTLPSRFGYLLLGPTLTAYNAGQRGQVLCRGDGILLCCGAFSRGTFISQGVNVLCKLRSITNKIWNLFIK